MTRFGLKPDIPTANHWVTFGAPETKEPRDWVYAGRLTEYGPIEKVRFGVDDEKVVAIFGKRGQGKSFTLGVLLEGLALAKPDPKVSNVGSPRSVLLLDPLNIFQWIDIPLTDEAAKVSSELRAQVNRAREWGLDGVPIRARIFFPAGYRETAFRSTAREFRLGVSDFGLDEWSALLGFDMVRDIRGQLLAEIHAKVTDTGWTEVSGTTYPPNSAPTIDDYMRCLQHDADINGGIYTSETLRALTQRLRSIASHEAFQGQGTPLTDILTPGCVSVLLLNALPADLRGVIASVLVRRIIRARALASSAQKDLLLNTSLSEGDREVRQSVVAAAPPKTWIVIDEAQDIVPSDRKTAATDAIVKLVKEGRNFGLSFVLTTQQPAAVDSRVLSQVETFLVHKLVSKADVDRTIENLKCPVPDEIRDGDKVLSLSAMIAALEIGQLMVSDTYARRCMVLQVRARVGAHGGFEA
jgi:hypothetical protein